MSKYTTEVRFICEQLAGYPDPDKEKPGFSNVDSILEVAAPKLFDFDWPIYRESERVPLEIKILRAYYTREICEETVGLWKLRLQNRLCEIMPYYNQLYLSTELQFEPLQDTNWTKIHANQGSLTENEHTDYTDDITKTEATTYGKTETKGYGGSDTSTVDYGKKDTTTGSTTYGSTVAKENTETFDTTDTITKTGQNLYSDTPQGGLTGISNNTYLTNATLTSDNETDKKTGTITNSGTEKKTGSDGTSGSSTLSGTDTTTTKHSGSDTLTYGGSDSSKENTTTDADTVKTTENATTDDGTETMTGKVGTKSYSEMLIEYRKTLLNIDKMVIDDLAGLFFGLWE